MHWLTAFLGGVGLFIASLFGGGSTVPAPAPVAATTTATTTAVATSTAEAAGTSSPAQTAQAPQAGGQSEGLATHGGLNVHALPLGDGNVASTPKVGYVYSCQTNFRIGGAEHAGNWITGSTWDMSKKIHVQGAVAWPSATFSAALQGTARLLSGNGLPVGATTGTYPIQASDPAYQYDRNPNSVTAYSVSYALPAHPAPAAAPMCLPMGAIGYALNGVAIYNALDDSGRDAVAHEVQDSCDGHPQGAGQYHYHGPSPCMPHVNERTAVVGYALDGYPITSLYDAQGNTYTNADLDACHGTTSAITYPDGSTATTYHYVLTAEYPYTLGCYHGTPVATAHAAGGGAGRPPPPR